ncbi:MAG: hypothetical protein JW873_06305 [Candidatus Saganbacteria bacterium]|nr:hypothetical protein [Candidatus Saganbacteria bacterium]
MRALSRFLFFIFYLLFFTSLPVPAEVIGSRDDPLTIGGGARPIGMGRAFTAVVDDADAAFINPAGLGSLKGPAAMAMYTNLLGEVYYNEFTGAVPTPYGSFGLGYITTGVSNIPTSGLPSDYYDSLLTLTYATPLANYFYYGRNIFVGANYKIFNSGYTGGINQFATGMSADLGVKVVVSPHLAFGVNRQNLLPVSMGGVVKLSSGAEESLASITKVGVAVKPVPWPKLLVAFDADLPAQTGRPVTQHLGVEWKENQYLAVRGGLDQSVDPGTASLVSWNPTFGTSLSYAGLRVDYAYHPYYNDPGLATNYISLSYVGQPWFALKGTVQ